MELKNGTRGRNENERNAPLCGGGQAKRGSPAGPGSPGEGEDLVGVERQRSLGLRGPRGLDREETHAPERARRRPQLLARKDGFALGREAPRAPVAAQPAVAGNLE